MDAHKETIWDLREMLRSSSFVGNSQVVVSLFCFESRGVVPVSPRKHSGMCTFSSVVGIMSVPR